MRIQAGSFGKRWPTPLTLLALAFCSATLLAPAQALEILSPPANASAGIGDTVQFSVLAQGAPPLRYQWRAKGADLPGETASSLALTNVQLSQAGSYSVVVADTNGSVVSASAILRVTGVAAWGSNSYGETTIPDGLGPVQAVAGGCYFSLALREDGTVAAWGTDESGQTNIPLESRGATALAAGDEYSLALMPGGTVVAWGNNRSGALLVPWGLQNVVAVSAGDDHSLALTADGTVVEWGYYMWEDPAPVVTNAVAIACGGTHNLALLTDGTVAAWPLGWFGDRFGETVVPTGLRDVVAVAGGQWHSLALKADGTVVAWGNDDWGQSEVPAGLSNVVAISAGGEHSIALQADGAVVVWGAKPYGSSQPPLPPVRAIAAGWDQDLMLLGDGSPAITIQPVDRSVGLGRPASLVVKAAGSPPLSYQWWFDGGVIPGATTDRYDVPQADPTNAGTYWATVSNQLGILQSYPAQITVLDTVPTNPVCPPVLPEVSDLVVDELTPLTVTNTATVCGSSSGLLSYSLVQGPLGATIDHSGVITWTPAENQGPSTNVFITFVVNNYSIPQTTATNRFTVVVNELNSPPVLPDQMDRTIGRTSTMVVINTAFDSDVPTNVLTYRLLNAPEGAGIDAEGIIRWTPLDAQIPSTNLMTTVVTDNGQPPLSATNQFTVVVLDTTNVPVAVIAGPILNPATGHEYLLLAPASWTNAERAAAALGGHLVTMNTDQENTWVYETFCSLAALNIPNGDVWIGLYDPDPTNRSGVPLRQQAQYRWISGQPGPVDLNLWASYDESYRADYKSTGFYKLCGPNNPGYNYPGHWKDEDESTPLNSVVERPLALEIISQPSRVSVGIGSDTTVRLCADSPLPISYQWQREGIDLPGATLATLTLTNVQPGQSGEYALRLSDATNSLISDPITLSVAGVVTWGPADARAEVPADLTNVLAIAAGYYHDLALKADGTVAAWGDNSQNQLAVPGNLTNVVAISGGRFHSLALKADGTVVAWGAPTESAIQVPADLTNVIAVGAGGDHSLALKSDGTVVAWGWGCWAPATVPAGLTNVVAISAGDCHDLALRADGTVVDWYNGDNTPADLEAVTSGLTNIAAISAGDLASLALRTDGTLAAWGVPQEFTGIRNFPSSLVNVSAISVAAGRPLVLLADGTVVAWGTNALGEGTVPTGLPNVVAIAQGIMHTLVLLRDGSPAVTVQPWDRLVPPGANPSFAAKAVGVQSMNYQWLHDGTAIEGATGDTLNLTNAQPSAAGLYTLTASNELGVAASRRARLIVSSVTPASTNHPPVLPSQPSWSVYELSPLSVVNTATDPDDSGIPLIYQLLDPPAGASIDSSGVIRWTPSEAQGPNTFVMTTVVTKAGTPPLSATNSFVVLVNEANSPPVLPPQSDVLISALSQLKVVNTATDPDIPPNTLTYQLLDPPVGATVDSNGIIRWTPSRGQGPATNSLITVVTDHGVPSLSATNRFTVIVAAPILTPIANYTINPGQRLILTNVATDNDSARHLSFSLDWAPNGASISSDAGLFSWRPPASQAGSSNYVRIRVSDDSPVPLSDQHGFSIVVNQLEPAVLQLVPSTNGLALLRGSGTLGPDYILQASGDLIHWLELETNCPVAMPFDFTNTIQPRPEHGYYRVRLWP